MTPDDERTITIKVSELEDIQRSAKHAVDRAQSLAAMAQQLLQRWLDQDTEPFPDAAYGELVADTRRALGKAK